MIKNIAKAEALFNFIPLLNTGARIINYELKGGATEQTHKFCSRSHLLQVITILNGILETALLF
jgi:hypothetical protein